MRSHLVKLADHLDKRGQPDLADAVDQLIAIAEGLEGRINVVDLMQLKPGVLDSLKEAIDFDLFLEPSSEGGNDVKAVPHIKDKWTDGLNLGDVRRTPGIENYFTQKPLEDTINHIESGDWMPEDEQMPMLDESEFKYDPDYLKQMKVENLEKARNEKKQQRDLDEALSGAVKHVEEERFRPESERSEEAYNATLPTLGPNQFKYDPDYRAQQDKIRQEERRRMKNLTEAEVYSLLVKMADQFDQQGNHALASAVDDTLKSFSARPKAPLKKLDDDVKKNLIVFIHDADRNTSKSMKGLTELFRRLRYFDLADSVKDLGLDKTVKELEKTQECLDGAKKKFFELMHGKKPSKQDLDALFKDLDKAEDQSALDFFDQHAEDGAEQDSLDDVGMDEDELLGSFLAGPGGVKDLDEDEEELSDEMSDELERFLAEEGE